LKGAADDPFLRQGRRKSPIDRLMAPLMLRYDPSGLSYLWQLVLRRKLSLKRE
jgi:hypothetical protein